MSNPTRKSQFSLLANWKPEQLKSCSLTVVKLAAFEAVIEAVHDNLQLGREVRRIQKWNGEPLHIAYGNYHLELDHD